MMSFDTSHHIRSLSALLEAPGLTLTEVLQRSGAFSTGAVRLRDVQVHGGDCFWRDLDSRPTYVRRLDLGAEVVLQEEEGPPQRLGPMTVPLAYVPWPCDDDAHQGAERRGIPLPAMHDDLYLNRPMVPVAQLRPRPGLHLARDGGGLRAIIVPDAGPRILLRRAANGAVTVRVEPRHEVTNPPILADQPGPPTGSPQALNLLSAVFGSRTSPAPVVFTDTTVAQLVEQVGPTDKPRLFADLLQGIVALLAKGGGGDVETDLDRLALRCYGDYLRDILLRAAFSKRTEALIAANLRRTVEADRELEAAVFAPLVAEADRQLAALLRPQGAASALLVPTDGTNTVAQLERRRVVSFFGAGGLSRPHRGRAWMRDTHPSYIGALCPLQTPESEDIGLVRFLAADARIDGGQIHPGASLYSAAARLIPYLHHDDPTRGLIGAKNLKQALPIAGAAPPVVTTGADRDLAELGVVRARRPGVVVSTEPLVVKGLREQDRYRVERRGVDASRVDTRWSVAVAVGQHVAAGQVLAHAPDIAYEGVCRAPRAGTVRSVGPLGILDRDGETVEVPLPPSEDDEWVPAVSAGTDIAAGAVLAYRRRPPEPELALGRDCLVAYVPWHGLGFEDGIVVSEALVAPFASHHLLTMEERLSEDEAEMLLVEPGEEVAEHQALVRIFGPVAVREVRAPSAGQLVETRIDPRDPAVLEILLRVRRPLAVGDKLTNRHGAKGVVSAILSPEEMPALPDGRRVEMILNPIGTLRRLALGQLVETAAGLVAVKRGERVLATDALGEAGWEALRAALDDIAPGGCATLRVGDTTYPDVAVGVQYVVKLDHRAEDALQVRAVGPESPVTRQPARGSRWAGGARIGGAQRMGEMELWCLQSLGIDTLLQDALDARAPERSSTATLDSVAAHLRAAGIATSAVLRSGGVVDIEEAGEVIARDGPDAIGTLRHRLTQGLELVPDAGKRLAAEALRREAQIEQPELDGGARDPSTIDARCFCSEERRLGARCPHCAGVARERRPATDFSLRERINLPEPFLHPWLRREAEQLSETISWAAPAQEEPAQPTEAERMETEDHRRRRRLSRELLRDGFDAVASTLPPDQQTELERLTVVALPLLPAGHRTLHDAFDRGYAHVALESAHLDLLRSDEVTTEKLLSARKEAARRRLSRAITSILGSLGDDPSDGTIAGRLSGKHGMLWRDLLGRRTEMSARAVIVPAPELDVEQVGLPRAIWDAFELDRTIGADLQTGDVVVINRQPSLHPYNLVALRAVPDDTDAVRINPLLCTAIAGDFDGDAVTVHAPVSSAARAEAWASLRPAASLRSAARGQVLADLELDVSLGLHRLVAGEGRSWADIARAVGADEWAAPDGTAFPAALAAFADHLAGWPQDEAGRRAALERLQRLQRLGFEAATGWSFSIAELGWLNQEQVRAALDGDDIDMLDAAWAALASQQPRLAESCAAGVVKPETIQQLLGYRGPVIRFDARLETNRQLAGCYLRGLTDAEYFEAAAGAIVGLGDKKLVSPLAGALTKLLVEVAYDVRVGGSDCGEEPSIGETERATASAGLAHPDGTTRRSPLTCALTHPCAACYGEDPATRRAPRIGDRIGLLAAQLIGERGTQLSMKAHRVGGERVGDVLPELRGLFGDGRFAFEGEDVRLADVFASAPTTAKMGSAGVGAALLRTFSDLMKGTVAPLHGAVILRWLLEIHSAGDAAHLAGGLEVPLLAATRQGQLRPIVEAAWREKRRPPSVEGHAKLQLVVGRVSA